MTNRAAHLRMAPVSNVERQRQFRERNPGYYNKYYRRRNEAEEQRAVQAAYERARAKRAAEAEIAAAPLFALIANPPQTLPEAAALPAAQLSLFDPPTA